jgi:hypothetical protein
MQTAHTNGLNSDQHADDTHLLRAALQGHERAFAQLFEHHILNWGKHRILNYPIRLRGLPILAHLG